MLWVEDEDWRSKRSVKKNCSSSGHKSPIKVSIRGCRSSSTCTIIIIHLSLLQSQVNGNYITVSRKARIQNDTVTTKKWNRLLSFRRCHFFNIRFYRYQFYEQGRQKRRRPNYRRRSERGKFTYTLTRLIFILFGCKREIYIYYFGFKFVGLQFFYKKFL